MHVATLLAGAFLTLTSIFWCIPQAHADQVHMGLKTLGISLTYDPTISKIHNVTDEEQSEIDSISSLIIEYTIDTRIDRSGNVFIVGCDSGFSDDFSCTFFDQNNKNERTKISGTLFEIPGDGCVYASGHNNTMFDVHRKFCISGNILKEETQPFHYAGLQSFTKVELTLYNDNQLSKKIGKIDEGEMIEVLVADI